MRRTLPGTTWPSSTLLYASSSFSFAPCLCFCFAFSAQQIAAGNYQAFFSSVNFNNFCFQFLADIRSEVLNAFQFNVGCRHKAFNAFNCNGKAYNVFLAVFNYAQNFNGCRAFFAFSKFGNVFPCCPAQRGFWKGVQNHLWKCRE